MDGYDDFGSRYDVPGAFEPTDDFDREPTPALLAAKAEPLSDSPASVRRPNRKPTSPNRSKASEAARASKARAANRRKPKEPSKLLLGAGVVAILLAGFATAYFLTRGGDEGPNDDLATESTDPSTDSTAAGTDSTVAGSDPTTGSSVAEPTGPPTVAFNEAALGPIEAGVAYTLGVQNAPADATYQLLVDDVPVNEPAAELPPTAFEPGRHLLVINIDSPAGPTSTGPVLVYALGPTPEASWRANLSSVNIETEGWGEAVTRFDAFVEAGHTNLQLLPSDRVPSLAQGYWNLFVGGFPDSDAAKAYCEQNGLSVPDQCFAVYADPNAPAGG